jgi:hypothetical protein
MGANVYAGTLHGVYKSAASCSNWAACDSGMTPYSINAFLVNGSNLFAATSGHGVFVSTNNGAFWTSASTGLSSTYGYIDALGAINSNLFAGSYETGIFLSTNNGANWVSVSNGLPKNINIFYQIQSITASGSTLFAATNGGGVYMSTNNGSSWSAANTGLTHKGIHALAVLGSYLFAGGDSTGVMRRPLSEFATSVGPNSDGLPADFSLEQNYPNPFNPATTIRYSVPRRSQVTLTVFNTLGQAVSTLVSGIEDAGFHEVKFDGAGLASGVYFYRLQTEGFLQTRRLLLLR